MTANPRLAGSTYSFTRSVKDQKMLLTPTEDINRLILYPLIIYAAFFGIQIHAFCAMTTHIHLVVTDTQGLLPFFLMCFHRVASLCIKQHTGLKGPLWDHRHTSVVRLLTPESVIGAIAYTLANPVSAGLVQRAHEWPGAKTVVDDIGRGELRAERPNVYFSPKNKRWRKEASLGVSLPPMFKPEEAESFREQVAAMLALYEAGKTPEEVLGAENAAKMSPEEQAKTPKPDHDRNPTFAIGKCEHKDEVHARAVAYVRAFRTSYRAALEAWRKGDRNVEFPAGTWAMKQFHNAKVSNVTPVI
jgi:REP element-mobilizing transposase RayT